MKDFLNMLLFDFLIGNSDRHQSNWAVICSETGTRFSPLYDNGSSLCSYISDEQAKTYLGKDLLRWKSLVDTKSKSLIRRTIKDHQRPTHLEMMKYIYDTYPNETIPMAQKIIDLSTEQIESIVLEGSENQLSLPKKNLICKFLFAKIDLLRHIYFI